MVQTLALLSGCFFPIYVLGDKLGAVSQYSPVTMVINTLFEVIYDGDFYHYYSALLVILSLSLVGGMLSLRLFKGDDYL